VLTFELRRRLFRGLIVSNLVFAGVGCNSVTPPPHTRASNQGVERASSAQTKRIARPAEPRQRMDVGVTENITDGDSREGTIEPRLSRPVKPLPQTKQREKKKIDDDERHPSKWKQKLKAKYA
jgi:hypothetical protein